MNVDPPRRVRVQWEDIKVIDEAGWVDRPTGPYEWKPYLVDTVGFVLYDGPEGLLVTDSIAADHIGPRTQIPRGCIVSISFLDDTPAVVRRRRKKTVPATPTPEAAAEPRAPGEGAA